MSRKSIMAQQSKYKDGCILLVCINMDGVFIKNVRHSINKVWGIWC